MISSHHKMAIGQTKRFRPDLTNLLPSFKVWNQLRNQLMIPIIVSAVSTAVAKFMNQLYKKGGTKAAVQATTVNLAQ